MPISLLKGPLAGISHPGKWQWEIGEAHIARVLQAVSAEEHLYKHTAPHGE